jgi:hypothetical protein
VLRANDPKSEMKAVQNLLQSQHYTATSHMNSTSTLITKLSRQTLALETNVNHVKQTLFGVTDGVPILTEDHPVL